MNQRLAACVACACVVGGLSSSAGALRGADGRPPAAAPGQPSQVPAVLATALGIQFVKDSTSTLILERNGKKYVVDLVAHTVRDSGLAPLPDHASANNTEGGSNFVADQVDGTAVFKEHCALCHGADGKGKPEVKTPNFTDPKVQASLTDEQVIQTIENGRKGTAMPPWKDELSAAEIKAVAAQIRSFGGGANAQPAAGAQATEAEQPNIYKPGDDLVFSLPTGRRRSRHGFYVNFSHRFAFDPAFKGTARGAALGGLDGFALPSFGFAYGVTDKLSVSIFRSPTFIGRPIQLMAAYNFLDERDGQPLNAAVRFSVQGLDNFDREFTENIEGVFSRSITRRAQIYFVPTVSFNDRQLFSPNDYPTKFILSEPGYNAVSLGVGASVDIRPTVTLLAEIIPTVVNGEQLGMHRPAFSFGIQKKIWRHSFTLGLTNSPGVTVSQRAGTLASFNGNPSADTPKAVILGFDLTRQIY